MKAYLNRATVYYSTDAVPSEAQYLTAICNDHGVQKGKQVLNFDIETASVAVNLSLLDVMRETTQSYDMEFLYDLDNFLDFNALKREIEKDCKDREYAILTIQNLQPEDVVFVYAKCPVPTLIDMSSIFNAKEAGNLRTSIPKVSNNIVFYHDPCTDGMGSKYAAWLFFGDEATYVPYRHGTTDLLAMDFAGADLFFFDCSVPITQVSAVCNNARSVVVVDHHISTQRDYDNQKLPENMSVYFDMQHSGAVLTWKYFFGDIQVPEVLRLIEDRDLWRFDTPERTYSFYYAQQCRELNEEFLHNCARDEDFLNRVLDEGKSVKTFIDKQIEDALQNPISTVINGLNVTAFNCMRVLNSDVMNKFLEDNPQEEFVAAYQDVDGKRRWSLRSKGTCDVSVIAKAYGGGGHAKASGFTTTINDLL